MDGTKISKAYEALEMLKSVGITPSAEQLRAIRQMENGYLEEEIIPLMKSELEPLFTKLRGDIKLEFNYSRETGVILKPYIRRSIEASPRNGKTDANSVGRGKMKYKIRVTFPNNTVSCKVPVLETLLDVVKYAVPERVQALNMMIMGDNLVSSTLNPDERYRAAQNEVKPGLYVCTYSSTDTKYEQIKHINKALGLGLQIDKILL